MKLLLPLLLATSLFAKQLAIQGLAIVIWASSENIRKDN